MIYSERSDCAKIRSLLRSTYTCIWDPALNAKIFNNGRRIFWSKKHIIILLFQIDTCNEPAWHGLAQADPAREYRLSRSLNTYISVAMHPIGKFFTYHKMFEILSDFSH